MTEHLVILLESRVIGRIERRRGGELQLTYDENWRSDDDAIPLSLSMPLALAEHGHESVHPFLAGLLPDNEEILRRWGQKFHVSHRNVFGLLAEVGEECAGAVRFVLPDRVDAVLDPAAWNIEEQSEAQVAERLRALERDASAWRVLSDGGQFSLAGAQPKLALQRSGDGWALPSGHAPTTHILKPPISGLPGHAENEHLSLRLAQEVGLAAANSDLLRFEDQVVVCVERFDRKLATPDPGTATTAPIPPFARIHQEDLCQALAVHPSAKYQNEGGPRPSDVIELILVQSKSPVRDVEAFLDALAFNWFIGGTDAHAKNYALLLERRGAVNLAPLYDLASALPYESLELRRTKLAMKIGGKYRMMEIRRHNWERLASDVGRQEDRVLARVVSMGERLPPALSAVVTRAHEQGLDPQVVDTWAVAVGDWIPQAMRALEVS